jgi:hypothetical protein
MKLKFLLFIGGIAICSSSAFASTVAQCTTILQEVGTNSSFDQLVALNNSGGCDVGNVNFDGFNTSFTASSVLVNPDGGVGTAIGQELGFNYSVLGSGTFLAGTIGYTATFDSTQGAVCPVGDTCGIVGGYSQLSATVGDGASITTQDSGGYTGSYTVSSASDGTETNSVTFSMIVAPAYLTKEATYNGDGAVSNFETDVVTGETSNTPEPTTFSLIGGGLLIGLGMLRGKKALPKKNV